MKILFFSYAYPNPINPGLGTFNRTMIAGLASEHEIRVVSPVPFVDSWTAWSKGRLSAGLNDPGFNAVPGVNAEYRTWYYTPKILRNQYGRFMSWSVRSALCRTMREFRPDVVLSYWTHPDGEVAVSTAHEFGVPAVTMVGGSDVLINARCGSRRKTILNVLRTADGIVAVSEDLKQSMITSGISENKIHVIRRGIDDQVFHIGERPLARRKLGLPVDRPIFISVGRLVEVKGHSHLIEACRLLAARGVDFRCYFLGGGPLHAEFEHRIKEYGLEDRIELRGPQSPVQLADWYRAANVTVLASLSEGVPNVLLESISCGTPFVASNVGGISEIADEKFDRLVAPAQPTELANAIAERLSAVAPHFRTLRRFEPPTMIQSAASLASILQQVKSLKSMPNTVRGIALNSPPIAETNGFENGPSIADIHSVVETNETSLSEKSDADDCDDDPLGRTGEFFRPSDLSQFEVANQSISSGIATDTKDDLNTKVVSRPVTNAFYVSGSNQSDTEDVLGRTGENFSYQSETNTAAKG